VPSIDLARVEFILLDIEGTTTPVDFVYRTLFGYARRNLKLFLESNQNEPEVRRCLDELKFQNTIDEQDGHMPPRWGFDTTEAAIASAAQYALWLMDRDSKIGPLKTLQGLIWNEGYRAGLLKGEVFADVPRAFDRWRRQGKKIAIYSSGSELAQRHLFGSTKFGDLSLYISAFFDVRVGAKTNIESYKRIASSSACPEDRFLFLSDLIAELEAARSAGMQTALIVRSESSSVDTQGHLVIQNFDALQ
jgi:enolase-phosphatase E1